MCAMTGLVTTYKNDALTLSPSWPCMTIRSVQPGHIVMMMGVWSNGFVMDSHSKAIPHARVIYMALLASA